MKLTDKIPEKLEQKKREFSRFTFVGVMINWDAEGYFLEQNAYSNQIEKLTEDCDFGLFRSTCHRLAFKTQTRPEILAGVNILSQMRKVTYNKKDTNKINSLILHVRKYPKAVLKYVKLERESLKIVVYWDACFAPNKDSTSQVGYLIFMADQTNKANITEYASKEPRTVVRYVLGEETFDLAD